MARLVTNRRIGRLLACSGSARACILGAASALLAAAPLHAQSESKSDAPANQPATRPADGKVDKRDPKTTELLRKLNEAKVESGGQPGGESREDIMRKIEAERKRLNIPPIPTPAPAASTAATQPAPGARPAASTQPAGQPGAKPAASTQPAGAPTTVIPATDAAPMPSVPNDPNDPNFTFNFTEPVELAVLVNYVRDALGIQVLPMDGGLAGQKVFLNAPITIPRSQVLPFLLMLLEQREYTMVQDQTGIYLVQPKNAVTPGFGPVGALSTTRMFSTPNIKPSSLATAITQVLNTNRVAGLQATQPVFLDDIGVVMVTDTPRNLELVSQLIQRVVEERNQLSFTRLELQHIAASAARDRVLELLGAQAQRTGNPGQPGAPGQPAGIGGGQQLSNLGERLIIDSTGNALLFRGRADEANMVGNLLRIVDVPNGLISKWYPVGLATAEAVSSAGRAEQLGSVTSFESTNSGSRSGGGGVVNRGQPNPGLAGNQNQTQEFAGAGFVLYPDAGGFIYRGTENQHRRVESLVSSLKELSERDRVSIEFYKLQHGKAEDVATIVQNLLTNSTPSGNSGGLIGRDLGGRNNTSGRSNSNSNTPRAPRGAPSGTNQTQTASSENSGGGLGELDGADVFVLADESNNQVLVKAPAKLQPQFRELIGRIDLRRPQVYIDAKVLVVTSSDEFDLAVEAQQIIGSFAFNTNFGLGALTTTSGTGTGATTTGGFTSRKNVGTGLSGFTAALIRSKDVPFIVNALARDVDGRVVATPQLLVDDNSEGEVKSKDEQPTQTTSQSSTAGTTLSGFGGFQSAGPSLKIKPQIAAGGYLKLEYEIELSSFTGSATATLPSPKQTNNIKSESVTVPSDMTIVVGGLTFDTDTKTVLKIPLIGDIPIVGNLFRDTSTTRRRTTLFVFITPKILRDPSFSDLRLLTQAPLTSVGLYGDVPPAMPERIDIIDPAIADSAEREKKNQRENQRRGLSEPIEGWKPNRN